jgi:L-ribulose-5-phosphate 4-epimerase
MLQRLREQVLEANLELVRRGLVLYTFGNASGISREDALVVIKPSGVPYKDMRPEHLVVTDLEGKIVDGHLRPSSDLPTHLVLYNKFPAIGGIAHTHSEYATAWAQARKPIPCFGTTHADYFHGEVPVTPEMSDSEIANDYEKHTGDVIVRALQSTDPLATWPTTGPSPGVRMFEALPTTQPFSNRLRAWPTSLSASIRPHNPWAIRSTTSTISENMARTPIMGRPRIRIKTKNNKH